MLGSSLAESTLADVMERETVFGRVTPEQKSAMVAALQQRGHVVSMTGDGVNDVLALKQADLGIAMGSGVPATRAVADIVLLDNRFATFPSIVAEGRRVVANAERVANLFLTKTAWAVLLALAAVPLRVPYPFLPRQITLAGSLSIGIPAFFFALASNATRYRPDFLRRVLRFAIPAGAITAAAILGCSAAASRRAGPLPRRGRRARSFSWWSASAASACWSGRSRGGGWVWSQRWRRAWRSCSRCRSHATSSRWCR